MIGLVGGTLGLFIGFSFNNVLTWMFEHLQLFALNICSGKSNAIDYDQESQNGRLEKDIQWEQKFAKKEAELTQIRQEKLKLAEQTKEEFDKDRKNLAKIEKDFAKLVSDAIF